MIAVAAIFVLVGCGTTVTGKPTAAGGPSPSTQFDKLLHECDAVSDEEISSTVGGNDIERYFLGAICMWDVSVPSGRVDVTFAWFENNSLAHERDIAGQLQYDVTDVKIKGASAFQALRPGNPAACGVTVNYSGVITWWVQSVGAANGPDPCEAARELAELTMNRNL